MKFGECLENVHSKMPLIHNITNYVTVNDVANVLLACGGSPIMADESEEVEDITSICGGLNINIGTLNRHTIPAMFKAGKKANELGHPVLLDPVGAGASSLRTDTAKQLLEDIHFSVIRGNISEIKTLAAGSGSTRGVDADVADAVTEENLTEAIDFVKNFAKATGSIIAVTGAIDLVLLPLRDKGHGGHIPGELRVGDGQRKAFVILPLHNLRKHLGPAALTAELLHVDLGDQKSVFKPLFTQKRAMLPNQLVGAEHRVGGGLSLAGAGVEIAAQEPCALGRHQLAAIGVLTDHLIAGG